MRCRTVEALNTAKTEVRNAAAATTSSDPQALLEGTRHLGDLYVRVKYLTVITARVVHGASWAAIADGLDISEATARILYEDAEQRWRDGDPQPWLPPQQRPPLRAVIPIEDSRGARRERTVSLIRGAMDTTIAAMNVFMHQHAQWWCDDRNRPSPPRAP